MIQNSTVHRIVTGFATGNEFKHELPVGEAYKNEGEDFFVVKLWERLKDTYYLSKNQEATDRGVTYTIFAKRIDADGKTWFRMPVGKAWMPEGLKTHIQLYFKLSKTTVFISLFPESQE